LNESSYWGTQTGGGVNKVRKERKSEIKESRNEMGRNRNKEREKNIKE